MAVENVKIYLQKQGWNREILMFTHSSATVELAAEAVGVDPARIAKTLSFYTEDKEGAFIVVVAGDKKIDNRKFKESFGMRARMVSFENVEKMTGHPVGGVCPFANPDGVEVYLDESLRRFESVFPAAGSDRSAVELSCGELERYSHARAWVDVCK